MAQQALAASDIGRARKLLARYQPDFGKADLSHWERYHLRAQRQSEEFFTALKHAVPVSRVSFLTDGHLLAWAARDGTVKIWNNSTRSEARTLQQTGQFACKGFSPNGNWLAATGELGKMQLWRTDSWNTALTLHHGAAIRDFSFSPDEQNLAVFYTDASAIIWDLRNFQARQKIKVSPSSGELKGVILYSPDHQWLAVGETDGRIRILHADSLREEWTFPGAQEGITALAFSPDGRWLASGSGYSEPAIQPDATK